MGESIVLTSPSDKDNVASIRVPWNGSVEMRINEAVWFDSFSSAASMFEVGFRTTDHVKPDKPYLICVVHMRNIDAIMKSWAVDKDKNLLSESAFDASTFTLQSSSGGSTLTLLASTIDPYPNTLALPLGLQESATLTLGFPLPENYNGEHLSLHFFTPRIQFEIIPATSR